MARPKLSFFEEEPLTVSIPRLSRLTGVSEGTLYLMANQGTLPGCARIGKRWVVHLETFNDYLKKGADLSSEENN
tara:strand:+ start:659 stop:883 length:225 start_codon:yes stop_codon:yes gene_type:complete